VTLDIQEETVQVAPFLPAAAAEAGPVQDRTAAVHRAQQEGPAEPKMEETAEQVILGQVTVQAVLSAVAAEAEPVH